MTRQPTFAAPFREEPREEKILRTSVKTRPSARRERPSGKMSSSKLNSSKREFWLKHLLKEFSITNTSLRRTRKKEKVKKRIRLMR